MTDPAAPTATTDPAADLGGLGAMALELADGDPTQLPAIIGDPNVPAIAAPALAPDSSVPPAPAPIALPAVIKIGDEEISAEEAKALIAAGRNANTSLAQANQLIKDNAEAMQLKGTWDALTPEQKSKTLDFLEGIAKTGQTPALPAGLPEPQAGAPVVKWEDMSDEARMTYALVHKLSGDVARLGRMLGDVQGFVGTLHSRDQDVTMVKALSEMGIKATPEMVVKMRENGITDPVKAFAFLKPMLAAPAVGTPPPAATPAPGSPPEAPTGLGNVYDDSDPNLTVDQEINLLLRGMIPASGVKKTA